MPQQARSRRTRRKVVEAAMYCFEELGYDETTTAVIAKRAGIAVGTLYGYFKNKGEVLNEVVDHALGELIELVIEQLEPEVYGDRDPREVVGTLIHTLFHSQTVRPGTQRVIFERYFKDDVFRQVVELRQERVRRAIVRFIESIDGVPGRRQVDPEAAAWVILNSVQWNAAQTMIMRGDEPDALGVIGGATADMVVRVLFD